MGLLFLAANSKDKIKEKCNFSLQKESRSKKGRKGFAAQYTVKLEEKQSKRHIKACNLLLSSLKNFNSLIKNMLFINSKITTQIKKNPFSSSLGLLERSANNHCWARAEIHYFEPAVMLMAIIITVIGGLVTCARRRYHYVTNIILPNP